MAPAPGKGSVEDEPKKKTLMLDRLGSRPTRPEHPLHVFVKKRLRPGESVGDHVFMLTYDDAEDYYEALGLDPQEVWRDGIKEQYGPWREWRYHQFPDKSIEEVQLLFCLAQGSGVHTNATRMIENVRTQLRDLFAVEKSKEVALKKLLDTYRVRIGSKKPAVPQPTAGPKNLGFTRNTLTSAKAKFQLTSSTDDERDKVRIRPGKKPPDYGPMSSDAERSIKKLTEKIGIGKRPKTSTTRYLGNKKMWMLIDDKDKNTVEDQEEAQDCAEEGEGEDADEAEKEEAPQEEEAEDDAGESQLPGDEDYAEEGEGEDADEAEKEEASQEEEAEDDAGQSELPGHEDYAEAEDDLEEPPLVIDEEAGYEGNEENTVGQEDASQEEEGEEHLGELQLRNCGDEGDEEREEEEEGEREEASQEIEGKEDGYDKERGKEPEEDEEQEEDEDEENDSGTKSWRKKVLLKRQDNEKTMYLNRVVDIPSDEEMLSQAELDAQFVPHSITPMEKEVEVALEATPKKSAQVRAAERFLRNPANKKASPEVVALLGPHKEALEKRKRYNLLSEKKLAGTEASDPNEGYRILAPDTQDVVLADRISPIISRKPSRSLLSKPLPPTSTVDRRQRQTSTSSDRSAVDTPPSRTVLPKPSAPTSSVGRRMSTSSDRSAVDNPPSRSLLSKRTETSSPRSSVSGRGRSPGPSGRGGRQTSTSSDRSSVSVRGKTPGQSGGVGRQMSTSTDRSAVDTPPSRMVLPKPSAPTSSVGRRMSTSSDRSAVDNPPSRSLLSKPTATSSPRSSVSGRGRSPGPSGRGGRQMSTSSDRSSVSGRDKTPGQSGGVGREMLTSSPMSSVSGRGRSTGPRRISTSSDRSAVAGTGGIPRPRADVARPTNTSSASTPGSAVEPLGRTVASTTGVIRRTAGSTVSTRDTSLESVIIPKRTTGNLTSALHEELQLPGVFRKKRSVVEIEKLRLENVGSRQKKGDEDYVLIESDENDTEENGSSDEFQSPDELMEKVMKRNEKKRRHKEKKAKRKAKPVPKKKEGGKQDKEVPKDYQHYRHLFETAEFGRKTYIDRDSPIYGKVLHIPEADGDVPEDEVPYIGNTYSEPMFISCDDEGSWETVARKIRDETGGQFAAEYQSHLTTAQREYLTSHAYVTQQHIVLQRDQPEPEEDTITQEELLEDLQTMKDFTRNLLSLAETQKTYETMQNYIDKHKDDVATVNFRNLTKMANSALVPPKITGNVNTDNRNTLQYMQSCAKMTQAHFHIQQIMHFSWIQSLAAQREKEAKVIGDIGLGLKTLLRKGGEIVHTVRSKLPFTSFQDAKRMMSLSTEDGLSTPDVRLREWLNIIIAKVGPMVTKPHSLNPANQVLLATFDKALLSKIAISTVPTDPDADVVGCLAELPLLRVMMFSAGCELANLPNYYEKDAADQRTRTAFLQEGGYYNKVEDFNTGGTLCFLLHAKLRDKESERGFSQCFFTIKKHEKNKNLYGKERPSADDRAKASDPGLKIVKGRKNLIETSGKRSGAKRALTMTKKHLKAMRARRKEREVAAAAEENQSSEDRHRDDDGGDDADAPHGENEADSHDGGDDADAPHGEMEADSHDGGDDAIAPHAEVEADGHRHHGNDDWGQGQDLEADEAELQIVEHEGDNTEQRTNTQVTPRRRKQVTPRKIPAEEDSTETVGLTKKSVPIFKRNTGVRTGNKTGDVTNRDERKEPDGGNGKATENRKRKLTPDRLARSGPKVRKLDVTVHMNHYSQRYLRMFMKTYSDTGENEFFTFAFGRSREEFQSYVCSETANLHHLKKLCYANRRGQGKGGEKILKPETRDMARYCFLQECMWRGNLLAKLTLEKDPRGQDLTTQTYLTEESAREAATSLAKLTTGSFALNLAEAGLAEAKYLEIYRRARINGEKKCLTENKARDQRSIAESAWRRCMHPVLKGTKIIYKLLSLPIKGADGNFWPPYISVVDSIQRNEKSSEYTIRSDKETFFIQRFIMWLQDESVVRNLTQTAVDVDLVWLESEDEEDKTDVVPENFPLVPWMHCLKTALR